MQVKKISLDTRETCTEPISDEVQHLYVGGLGVAAKLMSELLDGKVDSLAPEVPLIVSAGPLNASGFPSANRVMFYSVSPATELVSGAWMGGRFGTELAKTGTPTYVLTGRAPQPSIVVIDDDDVTIVPRPGLWGLEVSKARAILESEFPKAQVALIGPGGENRVAFAAIRGDEGHAAGRAGLGSVLGSKNIKAIVVRGSKKLAAHDPAKFADYVKQQQKAVHDNAYLRDVQGPFGTLNLVQMVNEGNGFPASNYRHTSFDKASALYGSRIADEFFSKATTCSHCPVRCRKYVSIDGQEYESPEYESLWALGPDNDIADFAVITKANDLCNEYGLDTVSTGGILAMYQEHAGQATDPQDFLKLIGQIATRTEVGEVLARGIKHVEAEWQVDYGMHVKGLELPAYHPKRYPGMGLAYATAQRGGCHCRAWTVGDETFGGPFDTAGLANLVMRYQNAGCIRDSLITCTFVDGTFGLAGYAPALEYLTGLEYSPESLNVVGERIFNLERLLNLRQGMSSSDDVLPKRLMQGEDGVGFVAMKEAYYHLRGWDESGCPTPEKQAELGIALE